MTRDLCLGSKPRESSSKSGKLIADFALICRARSLGEIRQGPKEPGLVMSTAKFIALGGPLPSKITHIIRLTEQRDLRRNHKEITREFNGENQTPGITAIGKSHTDPT